MTSLARRTLLWTVLPLAMTGCPSDDTTSDDGAGDSTSDTPATTDANTSEATPAAESSGGAAESSTSAGGAESTSGGSTSAAATSSTGGDSTGGDGASSGEISICGNNVIEGDEICDLSQLAGETCQSLGHQGGQLGCLLTCEGFNTLGCFICGNDIVDLAEDCEGTVPEDVTCETLGFQAGTVSCGGDCLYDVSDCSICGDGIMAGPEQCDGIDLGGQTCTSLGFDSGELGCHIPTCAYDASGCEGGQYTQDFEGGPMVPPEFSIGGTQGWEVDNNNPIAGMFSAHSGPITHNQLSTLTITGNFAVAGEMRFFHRESTESCCDDLFFFVDGVQEAGWSGTGGPVEHIQPVTAGVHTFEWRYDKDGSVNTGADTVWIDDVFMVNGVPL
ncbi:MAG: hypothetical protein AAF799_47270 [Myxococcota bacterium]